MEKEQEKYELSYLISPLLPEEKIYDEITKIREIVENCQGLIVDENSPSVRRLAYVLEIPRKGKFESAWFGWFRFVVFPDKLDAIKRDVDKNSQILRFLIVKSAKETIKKYSKTKKPARIRKRKKDLSVDETEKEKEIDKKIEEMISA